MIDFPSARRGTPAENIAPTAGRLVGAAGLAAGLAALMPGAAVAQACPSTPEEMCDLGTLMPDNSSDSEAWGVSADGSIVVGRTESADTSNGRAFRWKAAAGSMQDLGTLKSDNTGDSRANGVNADGSIVVGISDTDDGGRGRAFRWDASTGTIQDLGTLGSDFSKSSTAYGVNADGKVVVGEAENDAGEPRALIWRAGTMLDHANTGTAVQQSAQALAATAAHYGQNTVYQLGREVALRGSGGGEGARVGYEMRF